MCPPMSAAASISAPSTRGPGRRRLEEGPALDQTRLVEALVRLTRAEGVAALNMRRVAAELGVSPRLLYHFVRDKEDMLDLLGEAIIARNMPDITEPDWRQRLRNIAAGVRAAYAGYAGLPAAILARSLSRVDRVHARSLHGAVFAALAQAGLSAEKADEAYITFAALVLGGMVMVENIDERANDLVVARDGIERRLEMGIELLLFGIDRASHAG